MSVQELSSLHTTYVDLSGRFRAAWAFHQFIQSVRKALGGRPEAQLGDRFQELYGQLKSLSQNLTAAETPRIRGDIDGIERQLGNLTRKLLEEDSKVKAPDLRRFFQRVRSYDQKVLTQLVRFYIYNTDDQDWSGDLLDKCDFLLTRLSEERDEIAGTVVMRERRELREIFQGLWQALHREPPAQEMVQQAVNAIEGVRDHLGELGSLDEVNEESLIPEYRRHKHGLGSAYFLPAVLLAVMETNLSLKARIEELYRQEERRIVTDYQRIFEMEREVTLSHDLDRELTAFREEVEAFEKGLSTEEVKLDALKRLRERVKDLMPKLDEASQLGTGVFDALADEQEAPAGGESQDLGALDSIPWEPGPVAEPDPSIFGDALQRMTTALENSDSNASPKAVALSREMYPFRLEAREVVAHRRRAGEVSAEPADLELEDFLLRAAALRVTVNEQVEEVKEVLEDTAFTGEPPAFTQVKQTLHAADGFLHHFDHQISALVLRGEGGEAQQLQLLKMRLTRTHAGLWLMIYRPKLTGSLQIP